MPREKPCAAAFTPAGRRQPLSAPDQLAGRLPWASTSAPLPRGCRDVTGMSSSPRAIVGAWVTKPTSKRHAASRHATPNNNGLTPCYSRQPRSQMFSSAAQTPVMAAASDEQSAPPPGAAAAAGWPLGLGGLGAGLLAEPGPQPEEPWTAVGPSSSRAAAAAASRRAGILGAMLATCTVN